MRLAAQLVEAVVDSSLEHAILQEVNKGGGGADLCPGVVEGDVHVGMLLLLVHKGAQPWLAVRRQLVPVPYTSCVECTRGLWDGPRVSQMVSKILQQRRLACEGLLGVCCARLRWAELC